MSENRPTITATVTRVVPLDDDRRTVTTQVYVIDEDTTVGQLMERIAGNSTGVPGDYWRHSYITTAELRYAKRA